MKIVKSSDAQTIKNSYTSKLLEYSIGLNIVLMKSVKKFVIY